MNKDSGPVGLLMAAIHDNSGDKAIRLVMEGFFQRHGLHYEVLDPQSYDPSRYSRLVIGGGHLIRDLDVEFCRPFRVPGHHILNAVGVLTDQELDYLRDYEYVSVRSETDRRRLSPFVGGVEVVPCVALATEPTASETVLPSGTIGAHFNPESVAACGDIGPILSRSGLGPFAFIPFTHWLHDEEVMRPLAEAVPGSTLVPYLEADELRWLIGGLDLFVSSSLHACIFAYAANVPFLAFDGGQGKLREFCEDRGLGEWVFGNSEELADKLPLLAEARPDCSQSLGRDLDTLETHFRRLNEILRPHSFVGTESPKVMRMHETIRQRDFAYGHAIADLTPLPGAWEAKVENLEDELDRTAEALTTITDSRSYKALRGLQRAVDRVRASARGRPGESQVPSPEKARADASLRPAVFHTISLYAPRIDGQRINFSWHVEPSSSLYKRESFYLEFPDGYDPARVTERLWWIVFMACLHTHWALLRPCEVRVPVRLQPGEPELWARLVDAAVATLEAHSNGDDFARSVTISDGTRDPEDWPPLTDTKRCATSFSSGKDSLLQAALLSELSARPLLVSTRSPIPGLEDHHITPRRQEVFAEIEKRRDVELVEVGSNLRTSWDKDYVLAAYGITVPALSDTSLYFAALATCGYIAGATHLFMASEVEVQENAEIEGRIVQHPHFMYSAVSQRALSALIAPLGLSYGSLTWPLHSYQVQTLLAQRYPDLRDLQYTCQRVLGDETACNRCVECLKVGLEAVALGYAPSEIGVNLGATLVNMRRWRPDAPLYRDGHPLPETLVKSRLAAERARALQVITREHLREELEREAQLAEGGVRGALGAYETIKKTLAPSLEPAPGYNPHFLELVDPLLRERLAAIYHEHFVSDRGEPAGAIYRRSEALHRRIIEPLSDDYG